MPQCLNALPNQDLILKRYMLRVWWINILLGLGHYIIQTVAIEQVMLMANKLMNLGYAYTKIRLKTPLEYFPSPILDG